MKDKKFSEFIKEEKEKKYLEKLDKKIQQEIKSNKNEKSIYIKDSEGFAAYKPKSQISNEDIIISEQEYNELVGNSIKKYTRGGARKGAGRKKKFENPKKVTYEFEEKTLIRLKDYAKKHKKSQNELINEAVEKYINEG